MEVNNMTRRDKKIIDKLNKQIDREAKKATPFLLIAISLLLLPLAAIGAFEVHKFNSKKQRLT